MEAICNECIIIAQNPSIILLYLRPFFLIFSKASIRPKSNPYELSILLECQTRLQITKYKNEHHLDFSIVLAYFIYFVSLFPPNSIIVNVLAYQYTASLATICDMLYKCKAWLDLFFHIKRTYETYFNKNKEIVNIKNHRT